MARMIGHVWLLSLLLVGLISTELASGFTIQTQHTWYDESGNVRVSYSDQNVTVYNQTSALFLPHELVWMNFTSCETQDWPGFHLQVTPDTSLSWLWPLVGIPDAQSWVHSVETSCSPFAIRRYKDPNRGYLFKVYAYTSLHAQLVFADETSLHCKTLPSDRAWWNATECTIRFQYGMVTWPFMVFGPGTVYALSPAMQIRNSLHGTAALVHSGSTTSMSLVVGGVYPVGCFLVWCVLFPRIWGHQFGTAMEPLPQPGFLACLIWVTVSMLLNTLWLSREAVLLSNRLYSGYQIIKRSIRCAFIYMVAACQRSFVWLLNFATTCWFNLSVCFRGRAHGYQAVNPEESEISQEVGAEEQC